MIALCSFARRSKTFDLLEPRREEALKFPLRSQSVKHEKGHFFCIRLSSCPYWLYVIVAPGAPVWSFCVPVLASCIVSHVCCCAALHMRSIIICHLWCVLSPLPVYQYALIWRANARPAFPILTGYIVWLILTEAFPISKTGLLTLQTECQQQQQHKVGCEHASHSCISSRVYWAHITEYITLHQTTRTYI